MPEIVGSVTDLMEPLIHLDVSGAEDPLPVVVDTGFNGWVLLSSEGTVGVSGLDLSEAKTHDLTLADGTTVTALLTTVEIRWLAEKRVVPLFVVQRVEGKGSRGVRSNRAGVIGTSLLGNCRLNVDFPARYLQIADA